MAGSLAELMVSIIGDVSDVKSAFDDVDRSAAQMGQSLTSLGNDMSAMGKSMTMYVTAPLAAMGVGAFKTSMDFDDSMRKVQAVTGSTGDEFQHLSDFALQLGADTSFSSTQAADAILQLGQAGLTTDEIYTSTGDVLALASAGALDLGTAAELTANSMNTFGFSAGDTQEIVDVLSKGSAIATTDVQGLGEAISYAGPAAHAMGMSFEETTSIIASLSNAGIEGSRAGTTLTGVLSRLANPSQEAADALAKYGISLDKVNPATNEFTDILDLLISTGMSTADVMKVFGQEAGPGLLALMGQGTDAIEAQTAQLENCTGTAQQMADTMEGGVGGAWRAFTGSVETLSIKLGDLVAIGLSPVLEYAIQFFNAMTALPEPVLMLIVALAGLAAAIGPVLVVGGTLISSIGTITTAIAGAGGLSVVLTTVVGILTGPVAIAIAAFAAAAYLVYTNWGTVGPIVMSAVDSMRNAFNSMMEFIQPLIDQLSVFVDESLDSISAWWNENGPAIIQAAGSLGNFLLGIFETVGGVIAVFVGGSLVALYEGFRVAVNIIIPIVEFFGTQFGNTIMLIVDLINGDLSAAWDDLKAIFKTNIDFIIDMITNVLPNSLSGVGNDIVNLFSFALDILIGVFTDKTGTIATTFKNGIINMVADTLEKFAGFIPGVESIADRIRGEVETIPVEAGTAMSTFPAAIEAPIDTASIQAAAAAGTLVPSIVNPISTVPSGAGAALIPLGAAVTGQIDVASVQATAHAGILVTGTVGQISTLPSRTTTALNPFSPAVTGPIDVASVQAAAHAGTLVTGTINQVEQIVPGTITAMGGFSPAVVNPISVTVSPATSAANRVGTGATSGLTTGIAGMPGATKTTMNNVVSTISGSGSSLYSAAASAGQQAVNGLASKLSAVRATAAEIRSAINQVNIFTGELKSSTAAAQAAAAAATTMPSSGHGGSSSSSGSTGITRQGGNGTGESRVRIVEAHATGGIAGYTGLHWMEEGEMAIPQQTDWDAILINPIRESLIRAAQITANAVSSSSRAGSIGSGSSQGNVTYGGDTFYITANMSQEYDFDKMIDDANRRATRDRFRRGITS